MGEQTDHRAPATGVGGVQAVAAVLDAPAGVKERVRVGLVRRVGVVHVAGRRWQKASLGLADSRSEVEAEV